MLALFCSLPVQVLLMTLPAELISWKAPEKAELNLSTTFSDLSVQGWLSLLFIAGGFILMVFDLVGGAQVECRGAKYTGSLLPYPRLPYRTAPARLLASPVWCTALLPGPFRAPQVRHAALPRLSTLMQLTL